MISITACMDERDIAQEVVMERMVHKGSILLLEGATDIKRFNKFIDINSCSMVNCQSVRKAEGAMKILLSRKIKGAIAILDRDFRDILNQEDTNPNIIRSQGHDLDSDWLHSDATKRYLDEVASGNQVNDFGGIAGILDTIHETLRPVSAGRLLGVKRVFRFRTSGVDVSAFYASHKNILRDYCKALTEKGYVDESQHEWMEIEITKEMAKNNNDLQMSNGHDMCCALGKMLRSEIGSRRPQQSWGSEVEAHIRMNFDDSDFKSLMIFADIKAWEVKNSGFNVMDERFH